jgi:hypothetical protein
MVLLFQAEKMGASNGVRPLPLHQSVYFGAEDGQIVSVGDGQIVPFASYASRNRQTFSIHVIFFTIPTW